MSDEVSERRLRAVVLVGGAGSAQVERVLEHMPPVGAAVLVPRDADEHGLAALQQVSAMPVVPVRAAEALDAGRVYVVPAHGHVQLTDGQLVVLPPRTGDGVTLDHLMRVLAPLGRDVLVVVAPGAGHLVEAGLRRIREAGGLSFQVIGEGAGTTGDTDPGPCDLAVPLAELGPRLRIFEQQPPDGLASVDERRLFELEQDGLRDVLNLVRVRTGHDFSNYKRATLNRRIVRRLQVHQTDSIVEYHRRLRDDPAEVGQLLRDFLISVTNFFRDPEAFAALRQQVIPAIYARRPANEPVRVWVAGCATGEEAYSLAILLAEHRSQVGGPPPQIFATDIDESALAEARLGRYGETIVADVSPERLERFFEGDGAGYRVRKELRELVLFSPHNVLRDPPFSRLDLVSCRNLLIYLNREAQDRVLNMFHFGLRTDGYLCLGLSETAENTAGQFTAVDAKLRLFQRRMMPSSLGVDTIVASGRWRARPPATSGVPNERTILFGDVHHRIVEHYAPPSVLVNADLDIVHVSEHAGRFLAMSGGEPTRQLLRVVLPSLRLDVRSALYAARQASRKRDTRLVRFDDAGKTRAVELTVQAVDMPEVGRGLLLIMFDERDLEPEERAPLSPVPAPAPENEPLVRELEEELQRTREHLRITIEQHETSLEELKASNEELHAINEELRSTTEELETSKEEQQSVNEELVTLNQELKTKVDEISRNNSDLQNLMASTDIGVLFLDRNLDIKRFTPRAQQLVNVIATDIGRPLAHLTHHLDFDGLPAAARDVLHSLRPFEREVTSDDGRRHLVRILPYRAVDDRIEGVVVTFVDLTELRGTQAALETSDARLVQALREDSARKDQFLATVSHELRSPLTPLVAALDIQRMARGNPERIEKARVMMERQVTHLIRMVDELLDVTRVGHDISLVRERLPLVNVLQQAAEMVTPRIAKARQTLQLDLPDPTVYVWGDQARLDQVLVNVLTNASKFSHDGGRIEITTLLDLTMRTVKVSVRDQGIGIAPDILPRIFEMFVQAHEVVGRADGGLGIGLSLVKRLIELHGGTVTASSGGLGQGTELTMTLPLWDDARLS